jgi:hypothetical protein
MDTWTTRDLPVLTAIVSMTDEGEDYITPVQIAERTGLDERTVNISLFALAAERDRPFFQWDDGTAMGSETREMVDVSDPTGRAREAVGAWPTPESLAQSIVDALKQAADDEPDETKKGKLLDAAQRLTESVVGGVLTAWASGVLG